MKVPDDIDEQVSRFETDHCSFTSSQGMSGSRLVLETNATEITTENGGIVVIILIGQGSTGQKPTLCISALDLLGLTYTQANLNCHGSHIVLPFCDRRKANQTDGTNIIPPLGLPFFTWGIGANVFGILKGHERASPAQVMPPSSPFEY